MAFFSRAAKADSSTGPVSPTLPNGNGISLTPVTSKGNSAISSYLQATSGQLDQKPTLDLSPNALPQSPISMFMNGGLNMNASPSANPNQCLSGDSPPNPFELMRRINELSLPQKLMLFGAAAGAQSPLSPHTHQGGNRGGGPLMDSPISSGKTAGRYRCDFCDYHAVTPSHLRRHQRTHTGKELLPLCKPWIPVGRKTRSRTSLRLTSFE